MANSSTFQLPDSIVSPADLHRLLREAEKLNDQVKTTKPPVLSQTMVDFAAAIGIDLSQPSATSNLLDSLKQLIARAPSLHISLSSEPSPENLQPLVSWLRQNISPLVLVRVGLMPNLGAGCILRTQNKRFDFSLRHYLASKQELLIKQLISAEAKT